MHVVVVVVGSIILDTALAGPQPNPAQWSSIYRQYIRAGLTCGYQSQKRVLCRHTPALWSAEEAKPSVPVHASRAHITQATPVSM